MASVEEHFNVARNSVKNKIRNLFTLGTMGHQEFLSLTLLQMAQNTIASRCLVLASIYRLLLNRGCAGRQSTLLPAISVSSARYLRGLDPRSSYPKSLVIF